MASLVIVVSAVLVLSGGQTDRQTDALTDADESFTPATVVGASKYIQLYSPRTIAKIKAIKFKQ